MFCEKCGAELPEGTAFCSKCGAEQRKTELADIHTEISTETEKFNREEPVKIEKIHFDFSPTYTMPESKKSKAPVFVVTGLILVLIAAVTVLVASVFGQGNAKKVVKEAVQKTIQILQEEMEESIAEGKKFGYFLEITSNYYKSSYTSDEITKVLEELGDFRFFFYGNLSEMAQGIYGGVEVGMGDMKNIRLNYEVGKDGIYLSLPDLYEKAFFIPQDFLEDTTGTNVEEAYDQKAREEALRSLRETLSDSYDELFEKIKCAKIGKEIWEEYKNKKVTCYEVTISVADYQEYLESLLERLKGDTIFIDWLSEISSKERVEGFFDILQEEIERYQTQIAEEADFIILSHIYVDKKGQMVQWNIPFEDEEGEMVVSFLEEERLIDDIRIQFDTDNGYSKQTILFHYQLWDEKQFQSIAIDKKDSLEVVEENQEELGVALIKILYNISDKGYLPSQYQETLDELLFYLSEYEDGSYGVNSYDESFYDSWDYELTYSEDGNPILEDYLGKYQIELIAPPGTKLDLDWSYSEMICFMDEGEEQDYYYEIIALPDDVTDRFDYERSSISEEEGYKNIVFSDIMQKEINGYQVYYQYCSYDYDFMTGCKTYYAWVRLDEEYVFELYLDDYTNSVEDDILDGCFQVILPIK